MGAYNTKDLPPFTVIDNITNPYAVPEELKFHDDETKVLKWDGITYVPYSYVDNRMATCIVAYSEDGTNLGHIKKLGVRYIEEIKVDFKGQRVLFIGQGDKSRAVSWKRLKSII